MVKAVQKEVVVLAERVRAWSYLGTVVGHDSDIAARLRKLSKRMGGADWPGAAYALAHALRTLIQERPDTPRRIMAARMARAASDAILADEYGNPAGVREPQEAAPIVAYKDDA